MNLTWPTSDGPATISSGGAYGAARSTGTTGPHAHQGVDLGGSGSQALAAADGVVKRAYAYAPYGGPGIIDIDHEGGAWRTRYLHLNPSTFAVKSGDVVSAGQVLGITADSVNPPHVHFELLQQVGEGEQYAPVDPEPLLRAGSTGGEVLGAALGGDLLLPIAVAVGAYFLIQKLKG